MNTPGTFTKRYIAAKINGMGEEEAGAELVMSGPRKDDDVERDDAMSITSVFDIRRGNLRILAKSFGRKGLADRVGASTVQVNHIIGKNPVKNLGEKLARRWEEKLSLPPRTLDTPNVFVMPTLNRAMMPVAMSESGAIYRGDIEAVTIPVFDVRGSMGTGLDLPEIETVIESIRMPASFVRENYPHVSSPKNLKIITGYGNSMEPTFRHGDPMIVDTGVNEFNIDSVYVFGYHKEMYIKTIQRLPGGSITVISDNKVYAPFTISVEARTEVTVFGRIVDIWNRRRL